MKEYEYSIETYRTPKGWVAQGNCQRAYSRYHGENRYDGHRAVAQKAVDSFNAGSAFHDIEIVAYAETYSGYVFLCIYKQKGR